MRYLLFLSLLLAGCGGGGVPEQCGPTECRDFVTGECGACQPDPMPSASADPPPTCQSSSSCTFDGETCGPPGFGCRRTEGGCLVCGKLSR